MADERAIGEVDLKLGAFAAGIFAGPIFDAVGIYDAVVGVEAVTPEEGAAARQALKAYPDLATKLNSVWGRGPDGALAALRDGFENPGVPNEVLQYYQTSLLYQPA